MIVTNIIIKTMEFLWIFNISIDTLFKFEVNVSDSLLLIYNNKIVITNNKILQYKYMNH